MNCLIPVITWAAAAILVHFALRFAASTSRSTWAGARWRWWTFLVAIPCVGAGALGTALSVPGTPAVLALGSALFLVASQRRCVPTRAPASAPPSPTRSPTS